MAKQSGVGNILHAVAVRLRVTGAGTLQVFLRSLDDVNSSQLQDIEMESVSNKEPTALANFNEQGIQLELRTVEIDDTFLISKIIVFVKPVAESYPIL